MNAKEVAKLLANRVNQEHYILGLMEKLFLLGVEQGKEESNISDIRNKLSPISNLIAIIEDERIYPEPGELRDIFIAEITKSKMNISLLAKESRVLDKHIKKQNT